MRRIHLAAAVAIVFACAALVAVGSNAAKSSRDVSIPANVDVSQRHLNESEESIAVNPTNPNNIVIVSNVGHREAGLTAGMFEGVSFDGGATWTTRLIGNNDNLGDACCDPTLSFDQYGPDVARASRARRCGPRRRQRDRLRRLHRPVVLRR